MSTILIVDDHVLNRQFLLALLGFDQHRLLEAVDGVEGLALAASEHPDLIITDIMMPRMDGYEFISQIRADPALAAIPAMFYTSTYSVGDANAIARACGVRWVLQKPSSPKVILAAVNEALGLPPPGTAVVRPEIPAVAETGRFANIDSQLSQYLRDLDAGSGLVAQIADHASQDAPASGDLLQAARRLSGSLSDFQTMGLRLTALIDMGIELVSVQDPQRLIETGCRIARHVGVARFAVIGILNEEGSGYAHFTGRGLEPGVQEQIAAAPPPRGVFQSVVTQRRPQRLQGLAGKIGATGLFAGHPPLDSLLVVPIASPGKCYGWLYLGDKLGADRFSEIDEEVLLALASQIAVAYENVSLVERIQINLAQIERESSERQQIALRLRQSETRFRQLAENINEVFFLIDSHDSKVLYISTPYERIWGRTCVSLYADPRSWLTSIHPDDREWVRQAEMVRKKDPVRVGTGFDYRYRIVRPDGEIRVVHARGFPIRNELGEVYRIAGIAEDVTAYTRAMEALAEREAGLQRAQLISKLAHVITGQDGNFESWSETLPALVGMTAAELPPSTREWLRYIHPADVDRFRNCCIEAGRTGLHHEVDYRISGSGQNWIQIHQVLEPLPGPGTANSNIRWFNTLQDVSEQKEQQQKLARLSRIYAVQSGINSAIVRIHERQALLRDACRVAVTVGEFSMAWVGLYGEETEDGRVIHWVDDQLEHPEQQALIRATVLAGRQHPACRAARELHAVVCNDIGSEPTLAAISAGLCGQGHNSLAALPLIVGNRAVAVITLFASERDFFDKEEQKLLDELAADLSFGLEFIEKDERLNFLAYYDALTGLPNRTLFHDRLSQLFGGREQTQGIVCVVVINIDRFGQLNDAFGRHAGDAVLRMVAERLSTMLPETYSPARISGDTFAVALTGLQQGEDAASVVEKKILDLLEPAFIVGGQEMRISARAGLALYPADGGDAETVLKHAEVAIKKARSSATRSLYYAPQMNAAIAARLELENALRIALAEGQFLIHYQPRVDLSNGRIASAEALIRWMHPVHGMVPPVQFIPLCEETGLIVPIGAWVIDAVCAQQAAWRAQQIEIVPVAVNLSAIQFKKGRLMQTVRDALAAHELEQKYLEFELTESIVMDDPDQAITHLQALKAQGAVLSLDDFGTGYSSLAYLQRFPFDFVKIDRSFVTNITTNPGDAAIVNAVIAMAHSLNLQVVAEGVETEGQLRYLRNQRCDQMQGYFFSKPVAAAEFGAMLRADKRLAFSPEPSENEGTLLIVDDEPHNLAALRRLFHNEGYRVLTAGGGHEGLELLALNSVQVIVSDQRMPGMSGTEFLAIVKDLYPDTIRIILSGYTDLEVITDGVNRGAVFKFLSKPWDDEMLLGHIREALRLYRPQAVSS